jgi:peptidoglycan/LPS O-acetylase OafA/YrhL
LGKLTASSASRKPVLENLQALRGLAACLIMVRHAIHEIRETIDAAFAAPDYPYTIGVDIFFVISGFIMVYTSRNRFAAPGAWKDFLVRRLVRIVPLYWFYTLALVGVALILPGVLGKASFDIPAFLKSLFFIPYMNAAGDMQPFLALGWTLNYEMYFYAVFACFMFLPATRMLAALTVYFAATVIAGFYLPEHFHALRFLSDQVVLEFVAGAWLAWLYIRDYRLPSGFKYPAYGCAFLVLLLFLFPEVFGGKIMHIHKMIGAVLLVALLALPRGAEQQVLPRFLTALGDSSYTLYLSHPFALGFVTQGVLWAGLAAAIPANAVFCACVLIALAGGYFAYLFIEKPLLSYGKAVFLRKPDARPIPGV